MKKIIDKIHEAEEKKQYFYSFEYFPPKNDAAVENLLERVERMAELEPLFVDVTWGAGGSTAALSTRIAEEAQTRGGVVSMLHITCAGLTEARAAEILDDARARGIRNLLILRGDPVKGAPKGAWAGAFRHAARLVALARARHGDWFGVGVAGHPEGHPDARGAGQEEGAEEGGGDSAAATTEDQELRHLKAKVDAGADFILTQLFYDVGLFLAYVRRCRAAGITCPIVPGIMPIQNYSAFVRMTAFCGTRVPPAVLAALQPLRADDAAVKRYGVELAVDMCQQLLAAGCPGLHFYTLNLERSVREVLAGLAARLAAADGGGGGGAAGGGEAAAAAARKELPWRPAVVGARVAEAVRPINWANRPKSYVQRTLGWDEFPNGRWGDLTSPAFGELTDTHFADFPVSSVEDRKAMWGEAPQGPAEVYEVFARYVEGRVPYLPWCETPLQAETQTIQPMLAALNRHGFLTINSQPRVNGARSGDRTFGWGGPGGRVYQKAYVECFCPAPLLEHLIKVVEPKADIGLFAVSSMGRVRAVRSPATGATAALTWGSFPNREIVQPTVFDPEAFLVWKDEAFQLWLRLWGALYDEDSTSADLIQKLHDELWLTAVVDNDFVDGDLWAVFEEALRASTLVARRRGAGGGAPGGGAGEDDGAEEQEGAGCQGQQS